MEIVGWIGSFLFSICGIPQAIQSYRDGHTRGLTWGFLAAWLGGEILTLAYVLPKADWPLITNYAVNLFFLGVLLYYKLFERHTP